jgi:hypothetical protein
VKNKVFGSGKRDAEKKGSDQNPLPPQNRLPPSNQRRYDTSERTQAEEIKADARGQFARRRSASNPGGLHSANPVVLSGDGDATQPVRKNQDLRQGNRAAVAISTEKLNASNDK